MATSPDMMLRRRFSSKPADFQSLNSSHEQLVSGQPPPISTEAPANVSANIAPFTAAFDSASNSNEITNTAANQSSTTTNLNSLSVETAAERANQLDDGDQLATESTSTESTAGSPPHEPFVESEPTASNTIGLLSTASASELTPLLDPTATESTSNAELPSTPSAPSQLKNEEITDISAEQTATEPTAEAADESPREESSENISDLPVLPRIQRRQTIVVMPPHNRSAFAESDSPFFEPSMQRARSQPLPLTQTQQSEESVKHPTQDQAPLINEDKPSEKPENAKPSNLESVRQEKSLSLPQADREPSTDAPLTPPPPLIAKQNDEQEEQSKRQPQYTTKPIQETQDKPESLNANEEQQLEQQQHSEPELSEPATQTNPQPEEPPIEGEQPEQKQEHDVFPKLEQEHNVVQPEPEADLEHQPEHNEEQHGPSQFQANRTRRRHKLRRQSAFRIENDPAQSRELTGMEEKSPVVSEVTIEAPKLCRICHSGPEDGKLISPCICKGSMKFVHVSCLDRWRKSSPNPKSFFQCDHCKYRYNFRRTRIAGWLASKRTAYVLTLTLLLLLDVLCGYIWKLADRVVSSSSHRTYPFLTIDLLHLLAGAFVIGLTGFLSLVSLGFPTGPHLFGFGRGGEGSNTYDSVTLIIFAVVVIVGLLRAAWAVYSLVQRLTRKILNQAEYMVENVQDSHSQTVNTTG